MDRTGNILAGRGGWLVVCAAILLSMAAPASLFASGTTSLIGHVGEVHLANRVVVINGSEYRLSASLRFRSEKGASDLVTGLKPGDYVEFTASGPEGAAIISEINVLSIRPE